MKYEVYLTKTLTKIKGETIEVEADSPHEAVRIAEEQFSDLSCEIVTALDGRGKEICVVGYCEGCGKAILDTDKYGTDPEGIYLHKKCAEGME